MSTETQPTMEAPRRPSWGDQTMDRIARTWDDARQDNIPAWSDLPIDMRLAVIACYCAGRTDGGR